LVALELGALVMPLASMPAVAPVHEDVHERARENQKEGQVAKGVREMLGP
jgi:hypothetical protein